MDEFIKGTCPNCKKLVELNYDDLKVNCNSMGDLIIRCPVCSKATIKYHVELSQGEIAQMFIDNDGDIF
jgi:predicted RNA-binding Zn-ribbon protein involved in translation (DUF1610 family)